jgi:hypothetical protein
VILRIGAYTPYGDTYYLDDITVADSTGFVTGIEDNSITPLDFQLEQNYPNPFNPITNIRFAVPNESKVTLKIFNVLGQEISELVNDIKSAGYHNVVFDASSLSSGVYLYQISAVDLVNSKEFVQTKKLVLLK